MFGRSKSSPSDALYQEQESRDGAYGHAYEYRTLLRFGTEEFDLELNDLAKAGWELAGFQVSSGGTSTALYASLRRLRHP